MGMRTGVVAFPRTGGRWKLAENATMRLPRGRLARMVRVESGTVLITQEGDLEDHVLEPGDEIILRSSGLAVAWALTEAAICLRAPVGGPRRDEDGPAGVAA